MNLIKSLIEDQDESSFSERFKDSLNEYVQTIVTGMAQTKKPMVEDEEIEQIDEESAHMHQIDMNYHKKTADKYQKQGNHEMAKHHRVKQYDSERKYYAANDAEKAARKAEKKESGAAKANYQTGHDVLKGSHKNGYHYGKVTHHTADSFHVQWENGTKTSHRQSDGRERGASTHSHESGVSHPRDYRRGVHISAAEHKSAHANQMHAETMAKQHADRAHRAIQNIANMHHSSLSQKHIEALENLHHEIIKHNSLKEGMQINELHGKSSLENLRKGHTNASKKATKDFDKLMSTGVDGSSKEANKAYSKIDYHKDSASRATDMIRHRNNETIRRAHGKTASTATGKVPHYYKNWGKLVRDIKAEIKD